MQLSSEWDDLVRAVHPSSYEPATAEPDAWAKIEANRAAEALRRMESATVRNVASTAPSSPQSRMLPSLGPVTITGKSSIFTLPSSATAVPRAQTPLAKTAFSHAKTEAFPWPIVMLFAFGGLFLLNAMNERRTR